MKRYCSSFKLKKNKSSQPGTSNGESKSDIGSGTGLYPFTLKEEQSIRDLFKAIEGESDNNPVEGLENQNMDKDWEITKANSPIIDFLIRIGLQNYIKNFIDEEIQLETLEHLSDEDLQLLVPEIGYWNRLCRARDRYFKENENRVSMEFTITEMPYSHISEFFLANDIPMEQYLELFNEKGIGLEELIYLSDDLLKTVITKIGPWSKFRIAKAALIAECTNGSLPKVPDLEDVDELEVFLKNLKLDKFLQVFRDEEMDYEDVLTISESKLAKLIPKNGPLNKIMMARQKLVFDQNNTAQACNKNQILDVGIDEQKDDVAISDEQLQIKNRPRTTNQPMRRALKYKPCGVIMGRIGSGKTTMSNKLCGTKHPSLGARGSVTQGLYRNDVNVGANSFSLIDPPGTDSSTNTYKHALLLKGALTATKINTIFLILKYDNRYERITHNYHEVLQPVFKYATKTAVMISHMDVAKSPEVEFEIIRQTFAEDCPNVSNILFFSDKSDPVLIAEFMFSCMCNMEPEFLTYTDEEFHLGFNIYQMRNQIKTSFDVYEAKISLLAKEYAEVILSVQDKPTEEKDDILHMCIVEFKYETEGLYQTFIEEHGAAMDELESYAFAIKMQKENIRICDEFVEKAVKEMSYNLFDNMDIRNLIKRCPNCELIWYKTEGCDGQTQCGSRVSKWFDTSTKAFFRYFIIRGVDGKLRYEKNEPQKIDRGNEVAKAGDSKVKGVGCDAIMVWNQLPKIEDELILDLFKAKTIAAAVALVKREEFRDARLDFESRLDMSFHT